jgi:transposase
MDQQQYVGLDVSLEPTSICVVDQSGAIIWRGKCSTEPEAISQAARAHAPAAVIARGSNGPFAVRVREAIADNATLSVIIEPLLLAWQAIREQVDALDRQVNLRAKTDAAARRLMTVPGVGVIVALAYTAVIDNPTRFKRGTSVGAYLGLTPRRYQSG